MKEAAEFAESTQILMNVSEFTDVSQATDTLISAVQAFGYTADTSMEVVDLLNTIGNNYAISTADLAKSLTKSSASLVAAGGNLAEAAALTATANAIIQDADSVGTALKTTSLRLRGTSVKVLEEEGLDSDGAIESTSKLRSQVLATSGVDILTDTGAYKSTYQILLEIAEVWDKITDDKARAGLLELLAGKRNSSVIAALLQNPEDLKAAYEDAMNAEGSALKENERYLDSIQGKIDQFNNAMQAMWSDTLDSDRVKGIVEIGTEIIKFIDKIGLLPSVLGGVFLYFTAFKKNNPITLIKDIGSSFVDAGVQANKYGASLGSLTVQQQAAKMATSGLTKQEIAAQLVKQNSIEQNQAEALAEEAVTAAKIKQSGVTAQQVLSAWAENKVSISSQAADWLEKQSTEALTRAKLLEAVASDAITKQDYLEIAAKYGLLTATESLKLGVQGLGATIKAAMASNPIGWIMMAISAVVMLVQWVSTWKSETEELEEKLSNLNSEIDSLEGEVESLNSELETTQDRMEELLSKDSLSFVEEEELKNLKLQNELLEKKLKLQEMLLESKIKEDNETSAELIDNIWNGKGVDQKYFVSVNGTIGEDKWFTTGVSGKEALKNSIPKYAELLKKTEKLEDVYLSAQKELNDGGMLSFETFKNVVDALPDIGDNPESYYGQTVRYSDETLVDLLKTNIIDPNRSTISYMEDGIEMVLGDLLEQIPEDYEYGSSDIIDQAFDELTAYRLKYENAQGLSSKSEIINTIFGAGASAELQSLEKELQEIASSEDDVAKKTKKAQELIQKAYESTDEGYKRLKNSIDIVDISVEDLAKSFIATSEAADLGTLGGVLKVFANGEEILKQSSKYREQLKTEMTELQKDGSVDLLNRPQIKTTDMMKAFYSKEEYAEALAKELEGVADQDLSTVWTQTFSNKDFGLSGPEVAMNFTPILPDGTVMEKDEFEGYVVDVLGGAEDTLQLKIGATFDGENAIEEAAKTAERIHILQQDYFNQIQLGVDEAGDSITWDNLFTEEEGEKVANNLKVSSILKDADESVREQFTKLIEEVENGKMGVDEALSKWKMVGADKAVEALNTEFEALNSELFPDAQDEISGLIDTLSELKSAFESVASTMDTFKGAQEEYNNTGRVSIKTALELMSSTDDWNEILKITEDSITLIPGAEEALMKSQLESIATQMQTAADMAKIKLEAAESAQKAKQAFDEEANSANNLSTTEQNVNTTQQNANITTQQRTGAMGDLAAQTYGTAISELDYAANDGVVQTAESVKAKAIGLVSASIVGLDAFIEALLDGPGGKTIGEAWSAYQEARDVVIADADTKTTNIDQLRKDYEKKQTMANLAANGDNYGEFSKNWENNDKDGDGVDDDEEDKFMEDFQREMEYWKNRIAANQARYEQLQNEIDLLEAKGQKADASYYEEQIKLENERRSLLEQQRTEAQKYLAEIETMGLEGSDEWWEIAGVLNDIESELDDVTASIVDLQDAIGEIDTYKFEEFNTRLDDITSKLGTIRDLIAPDGEEDWFNDQGEWTEEGVAVLGAYIQELETYKNGLAEAEDAYANYVKEYAGNEAEYAKIGIHSEQELYDKRQELIEQQYDYAQSISDTEQSVVDMYESNIDAIEEYTETLIDSYNDYIDSVKEALSAEKDLYEFKRKIEDQSKNLAETERKIAALSGSTAAADIAERRRLEQTLYEQKRDIEDSYRDYSNDSLNNALDDEQSAYEETMSKFVQSMRTSLETATQDMDTFLGNVTTMVTLNAGAILEQYQQTELPLDDALTNPWEAAKEAVGNYSGDALELMNTWAQNGFLTDFPSTIQNSLESPWKAGQIAVNAFKTSVDTQMKNVVSAIETNIKIASSKLSTLYQQIQDTANKAAEVSGGNDDGETPGEDNKVVGDLGPLGTKPKRWTTWQDAADAGFSNIAGASRTEKVRAQNEYGTYQNYLDAMYYKYMGKLPDGVTKVPQPVKNKVAQAKTSGTISGCSVSGLSSISLGQDDITIKIDGRSYDAALSSTTNKATSDQLNSYFGGKTPSAGTAAMLNQKLYVVGKGSHSGWNLVGDKNQGKAATTAFFNKLNGYAKGTTGTKRDQWAITDEPQFGDELVLVPGKDGNLSFMRKGTGVVPADMTQKLFELAQIPTSDLMNKNLTAIVPNITKNDFKNEFNFESLVHVDTVDSDTLPKLEKMVDKKIDDFSRALNYSLKKFTR